MPAVGAALFVLVSERTRPDELDAVTVGGNEIEMGRPTNVVTGMRSNGSSLGSREVVIASAPAGADDEVAAPSVTVAGSPAGTGAWTPDAVVPTMMVVVMGRGPELPVIDGRGMLVMAGGKGASKEPVIPSILKNWCALRLVSTWRMGRDAREERREPHFGGGGIGILEIGGAECDVASGGLGLVGEGW